MGLYVTDPDEDYGCTIFPWGTCPDITTFGRWLHQLNCSALLARS